MKTGTGLLYLVALLIVTALPTPPVAGAQPLPHLWSRSFGDDAEDSAGSVVVDDEGNLFITGWFRGSIDFGGGPLISAGTRDIYLAKLDANGNHIWSRRFGDADHQIAVTLAVNSLGQPVIAGSFMGSVDFGLGNHTSAGGWDLFVAKFNENGVPLWTRSYGDAEDQIGAGVGVGSGGAVCVTGHYRGSVGFGGGALPSAGGYDIFLFRLDSSSGFH
ncbi:MAG: hypothetical protein GF346_03430, partial [Candidatus Eisenbacteria bacterium]|nr:hypothetical protein [Candidatus Latescibacterota bacterium]MBD3301474.1 hypothetical protein [Candidatus Eisenbacteria bacterium]